MKKCLRCGSTNSRIIDSRMMDDGSTYRRHKCKDCGFRWSTIEIDYNKYIYMRRQLEGGDVNNALLL